MSPPLRLDSSDALPAAFVARLARHRHLFQDHEFLDTVPESRSVRSIADDLEAYLKQQRIHGYHCTKEPSPGFFETRGLRPTNVQAHQAEFLSMFGDQFTADEVTEMKAAWEDYFERHGQRRLRDGFVWACLSRSLVKTSGTETFFRFFGGESIFMPLKQDLSIASKLETIGRAVVVEVALPGDVLKAGYEMSLAVLSRHHATIRPDAYPYESEARLRQMVPPTDIICVTPLSEFQP
ncbi:hypothetical protein ACFQAT_05040 [Undibacterium arcticum]|uniref:Uncharacterized protein n=1 Tax=Undibacterium arcticum TaxID=1762892 RepID=A0ABV7F8F0_9BURK